eukprot:1726367-Rhodomonas_salina.1
MTRSALPQSLPRPAPPLARQLSLPTPRIVTAQIKDLTGSALPSRCSAGICPSRTHCIASIRHTSLY